MSARPLALGRRRGRPTSHRSCAPIPPCSSAILPGVRRTGIAELPRLLELVDRGAVGAVPALLALLALLILPILRAAEPLLTRAGSTTETRSIIGESAWYTLNPGGRAGTRMIAADDEPGAETDREH